MTRRLIIFAALCAALLVGGCGSSSLRPQSPATKAKLIQKAIQACPKAANGAGHMGACAPPSVGLHRLGTFRIPAGPIYPDRSNNDPTSNVAGIARDGHPALVVKINQGTGFIDRTAAAMLNLARRHGLAVGGYDFVEDYDAAEAYVFVKQLRAVGACSGRGVLPPTLDVEYGAFSYSGLAHMEAIVRRSCGRVKDYTGAWYWTPHAGCRWPAGTPAWLSGYPFAPIPCGLPRALYLEHQFTSDGCDGASCGVDLTRFNGTMAQFRAFAHIASPKPKPNPRRAVLLHRRAVLRVLLTRHRCRTGHAKPARYRSACRTWLHEGQIVNRQLKGTT